jgi:hypothetical protein
MGRRAGSQTGKDVSLQALSGGPHLQEFNLVCDSEVAGVCFATRSTQQCTVRAEEYIECGLIANISLTKDSSPVQAPDGDCSEVAVLKAAAPTAVLSIMGFSSMRVVCQFRHDRKHRTCSN